MLRVYRIDKSKVTSNKYFPSRLSVRLRPIFFLFPSSSPSSSFLFLLSKFSFPERRKKHRVPIRFSILFTISLVRGEECEGRFSVILLLLQIESNAKSNGIRRERERERKIVLFLQSTITVCVYVYYRHFEYLWIQITIRKLSRFSSYKSAIFPVLFLLIKPSRNSTPFPIMRRVWSEF